MLIGNTIFWTLTPGANLRQEITEAAAYFERLFGYTPNKVRLNLSMNIPILLLPEINGIDICYNINVPSGQIALMGGK